MKRLLLVAPILVVVSAGLAAAEDHLVCYKIKDPLKLRSAAPTWLDLTGPQFGSEQCKVIGGFRLFCVPVDKTVTAPLERKIPPGSYQPFTPNPTPGLGEQDRLCYKIRCTTNAAPPSLLVQDQFAARSIAGPKPYLVCGPADKVPTSTTSTTPPVPTTSTSSSSTSSTTATSTTSTTSTSQPPCCTAGGFLSLTTTQANMGADAGDVTRVNGSLQSNLLLGGLYLGGGNNSAPLPHVLPDLSQLVTEITSLIGCSATLGPSTSTATGTNRNCTAPGCLLGPPVPITTSLTPPASLCLVSAVSGAGASGTSNCCTGTVDLTLPVATDVYLQGDGNPAPGIQPCPLCQAGVCAGGPNNGMACVAETTALNNSYPTSQDCPPAATNLVATLGVSATLSTGVVSWTATPATNDTGSTASSQMRVFCGYCRDVDLPSGTGQFESPVHQCWENGMAVNAACSNPFESCEQRGQGAFGPNGNAARTITGFGTPAAGICNPANARLASIYCIPPTFDATIDAVYDLPGPAASVVEATTQFCSTANPCP